MPYLLIAFIAIIGFSLPLHSAYAEDKETHSDDSWQPLQLTTPYAFATSDLQKNGAAFATITNTTNQMITIVDAHSEIAGRTEIHEMAMDEGIMKMRKLPQLQIPAKTDSLLEPGGNHIMFMELKEPLVAGSEISVSLEFADGVQQEITIPVVPAGQKPEAKPKEEEEIQEEEKADSDHTDYE